MTQENNVIKKILVFIFIYTISINSFSEDNDVLMRMYERLEMIRMQMQQLTEENQQLNNKISNLHSQQDRLYQDLSKKIEVLQSQLNKKSSIDSPQIPENIPMENKSDIENKEKSKLEEDSDKKKESLIPKNEYELDLAKTYVNENFKKNQEIKKQVQENCSSA